MERLTRAHYKASDGHYLVCSEMCEREDCTEECGHFDEAIERLAAYEDTGLTPEEVLPKDKADEIALKLMRLADLESFCSYTRLRELAEADKDGRLAVLPYCKLGDTVYWLHDKKITECRVYRIQENTKGVQIAIKSTVSHGVFSVDDYFGKTIFLTREEAEKTLEGER